MDDALKLATINPAKVIGHDQFKGKIEVGQQADLIILDDLFKVKEVIFKGKKVNRTFQH